MKTTTPTRYDVATTLPATEPLSRQAAIVMLALLFGLLSLAAVLTMRVECGNENQYVITNDGKYLTTATGARLITNARHRQCQLIVGNTRVPLPAWAQAITLSD